MKIQRKDFAEITLVMSRAEAEWLHIMMQSLGDTLDSEDNEKVRDMFCENLAEVLSDGRKEGV